MSVRVDKEQRAHDVLGGKRRGRGDFVTNAVTVVRTFFEMLRDGAYHFPMKVKVFVVLALIYLISPIDLAPELLLGPFGVFDDIGVLLLALNTLVDEVWKYREKKDQNAEL